MNVDNMFAQYTTTSEQKRRMNSLRNCARMLAREIRSSTPAGPNQTLAIRHVEDALMRAQKAIVEDAQHTAEQSWTAYFDLEESGSYVVHDGELFREELGGTYTPVGNPPESNRRGAGDTDALNPVLCATILLRSCSGPQHPAKSRRFLRVSFLTQTV
jgi:hypothetical protein